MHSEASSLFPRKLLLVINNDLDDCDVVILRWATSYCHQDRRKILITTVVLDLKI